MDYWGVHMNRTTPRFTIKSKIYSFTTENLGCAFEHFAPISGSVLTVAGSGDQIFEALIAGASEVVAFDLNERAIAWSELKCVALKEMTLHEFLLFFARHTRDGDSLNLDALDFQIYLELRPKLSSINRLIIESLYRNFQNSGFSLRNSEIFNLQNELNPYNNNRVTYLEPSQYAKAKAMLRSRPITLVTADLSQLRCKLSPCHRFEMIYLSNIADYAEEMFRGTPNYLSSYFELLRDALSGFLAPQRGEIAAAYLYAQSEVVAKRIQPRSKIDQRFERDMVTASCSLQGRELALPGVVQSTSDHLLVVKPKKHCEFQQGGPLL